MWNTILLIIVIEDFSFLMTRTGASGLNNIKISRLTEDYFPKFGNLELTCEAEGKPTPSVTWYNAQTMTPVLEDKSINLRVYKDAGLLLIRNPGEKEIYEFYCNASNGFDWRRSNSVRTGRAFLSFKFRQEPVSIQVLRPLQSVLFSCRPPLGVPYPKVTWLKDGKPLSRKVITKETTRIVFLNKENEQSFINITKVKQSDSGRYLCVASNEAGRVVSSGSWLIVSNNAETSLSIKIEDRFTSTSQDVSLHCVRESKKNIRWISSWDISSNNRVHASSNSLLIKQITPADKGIYACETNDTDPQLLKIYRLDVGSTDSIEEKIRSRKKVVIEGVNVILECDMENTQTEFYWETPNSIPIFPQDFSQARIQVTSSGNLSIRNVQSSDSGKYTCNVHSSLDVVDKSIWLEVSKHQLDSYPVISIPCQNMTLPRGFDINLRCEVIGEDIVKVFWYKGLNIKLRLLNNNRISFPSKDSLKIVNANQNEDPNFYTCEAVNDQNKKSSWTCFVDVVDNRQFIKTTPKSGDLPLPPVVESPKNIKSTSLDLTWSSTGRQKKPVSYWIEYVYFGSNVGWSIYKKDWKENFLTIENLNPDTWYQFLVRTKDEAGIGRASVPTEYVKTSNGENLSWNIGFSFSKIKLHTPSILNEREMKLIWSLNRVRNEERYQTSVQFYLLFKPVSILQCVVEMSNGQDKAPILSDYCSLTHLPSEKLKALKESESSSNESNTKLPIDFSKINLTKLRDLDSEDYAQITFKLQNFAAFHCFNVSIISDCDFKSVHSNNRLLLTPESKPSRPPEKVQITWVIPEISININWQMPHRKYWNGILTGSSIYMKSNESEMVLKYNNSIAHKLITRVNSEIDWTFQITLSNCAGESQKSLPVILQSLRSSSAVQRVSDSIFKKTWIIVTLIVTSILIWVLLCSLTVYLCCIRSNHAHNHKRSLVTSFPKDTFVEKFPNNRENEKILQEVSEDKSSSNNCASSGQSSSPSCVSFCNPYASTQLFDSTHEKKLTDLNLFYLATPIFEPNPANIGAPLPLNYYLSNSPEWIGNKISPASFQQNPKNFPFQFPDHYRRNSNDSDIIKAMNEKAIFSDSKIEDNSTNNKMINNLLISTAPFSDQVSASSKGKSTPNSSNSNSIHTDQSSRYGIPSGQARVNRRRQDHSEVGDLSTEMTHLLLDNSDKSSPCIPLVYDIPCSESSLDSRMNSQLKE